MTGTGIAAATAIGVAFLFWVVNLIRQDRLYAGYGVIFVFGTIATMAVLVVPPLLRVVTAASVALLPVPSLSLIAIVILTLLVVYVFIQISVLSNRVMRLTQELAIRNAQHEHGVEPGTARPH
jgi:hypothetical protein